MTQWVKRWPHKLRPSFDSQYAHFEEVWGELRIETHVC